MPTLAIPVRASFIIDFPLDNERGGPPFSTGNGVAAAMTIRNALSDSAMGGMVVAAQGGNQIGDCVGVIGVGQRELG
jgi:hypothetical protein